MRARFINERSDYWNQTSPNFPEYQSYWNELVPDEGEANTLQGELLRMASRIMYDYYNNGFGNDKSEEAMFLNKHQNVFKPFMKDPNNWNNFFNAYKSINFGSYEDEEEDDEYYGYGDDEDEDRMYEAYLSKSEEQRIEDQLDDIMDGIIKYIRLTQDKLIPLN